MVGFALGERPTTIGVVGPASAETALRDARAAVGTDVSVRGLDDPDDGVPEPVDCVVAATESTDGERTDGGTYAPPTDVTEWASEAAPDAGTPPVVLLAPSGAAVTAALRAGVAEYLPRSAIDDAPATVLRRAIDAVADAGAADYRAIYDNVSEPLTLHDPDTGELVHANQRLCELLGYDRAELVAMQVVDYTADIEGYDQTAAMEIITSATEGGVVGPVEWPLETTDGEQVWVEATLTTVEVGGQELVLSTATDVTDRRRQRRQLREITAHVDEVVYLARADLSEVLFVNDAYAELFGQPPERVYEDPLAVLEAVHPEDREAYRADLLAMSDHVRAGASDPYEFSHRLRVDGETRWVEVTGYPSRGPGGDVDRVVGVVRDVTDARRREREYEQIFHGVNDAIAVHDPETGEIVDVNDSYLELYGYDREDILRGDMSRLSVPEEGYTDERARDLVTSVAESGSSDTVEWRIETADGERRTIESNLTVATVGGQRRVLSLIRDVTEQRRREREYEQIFHGVPDPITIHDPATAELLAVNDALCEVLGYDRETILERGNEILATEQGYGEARIREVVRRVMESGEPETFEWKLRTADGDARVFEVTGKPAEIGGEPRYVSMTRDVTERRQRERDYERIFDRAAATITLHAPGDPTLRDVNRTLCDLLGYDRETLVGTDTRAITADVDGYDAERVQAVHDRAVAEDDPVTLEWPLETRAGETRWIEATLTTATIEGDTQVIATGRDITEAKRREREYEQIFHGANDVITIHDPETGEYLDVNDTLCELTGYDRETILEIGIDGVSATADGYTAERAKAFIDRVVETGTLETTEWKIETADGGHRWLEVNGSVATIGGEPRYVSLSRDITEQKRREREYEQIFHGVNDAIAVHDPETGEMVDVNATLCELTGYGRKEILGRGPEGLLVDHPEVDVPPAAVPAIIDRVMDGEDVDPYEQAIETADGERLWIEVNPTRAVIGGEERFLAISRDVTERVRREREFEQIFHGVTDVIGIYDPETAELLDVNDTMCDLLGYDRETILEMEPTEVTATELGFDAETIGEVVRGVAETGEPAMDIEWALRTASGETLWLEVNATLAELSGERRVVTIARDVTGRRDREERVQVLNRVLRHNVRNDMDAVIGYATAVEDVAERERAEEHARQVREIAEDLLALSGKARAAGRMLRDHDRRETRPLGTALESVVADVRDAHGGATVEVACEPADVPVEAGVFQLVVRELVENAVNHAGDAPSIEVRATPAADGDGPTVTVRDDGPGIPDRVLTPFRAGGETQFRHNHGIGLWLVNWGVRRLGGRIEFERPTDGGTIARLHLPDRGS